MAQVEATVEVPSLNFVMEIRPDGNSKAAFTVIGQR